MITAWFILSIITMGMFIHQSSLLGENQFMKEKHWYVVIMAGGKGERLWPLSNEHSPKQVLPFKGGESLLQATVRRVSDIVPKEQIWVITADEQSELICHHIEAKVGKVLSEPAARNTAAAILYTCMHIQKQDPEAVIAFLPADHYIQETALFMHNIEEALAWSNQHRTIVLLGIKPTFPATGYGYIEHGTLPKNDTTSICQVLKFHEKPSKEIAQHYYTQSNMLWNAGIFCSRADVFIDEFKQHASKIYQTVDASLQSPEVYKAIENISVDHAIMEKSQKTEVLPTSFTWSDVGNLNIFLTLLDKHQNKLEEVAAYNSSDNLVYTHKKHIALIGVHNLCVVETENALLIADREQVEEVKKILNALKN